MPVIPMEGHDVLALRIIFEIMSLILIFQI